MASIFFSKIQLPRVKKDNLVDLQIKNCLHLTFPFQYVTLSCISFYCPANTVHQHFAVSQMLRVMQSFKKNCCLVSHFTSYFPMIKKHSIFITSSPYCMPLSYLPPFISLLFLPPTVISGLISPVTLQTLPIHSSLSYPLYPNSPTSLYFYHSIAVISLWHCFNTSPLPHLSSISRLPLSLLDFNSIQTFMLAQDFPSCCIHVVN